MRRNINFRWSGVSDWGTKLVPPCRSIPLYSALTHFLVASYTHTHTHSLSLSLFSADTAARYASLALTSLSLSLSLSQRTRHCSGVSLPVCLYELAYSLLFPLNITVRIVALSTLSHYPHSCTIRILALAHSLSVDTALQQC